MGRTQLTVGLALSILWLVTAILTLFAARFLGLRRHRIFCLVIGCLSCSLIPWGTVLGVCMMMVLNRPSVKDLFDPPQPAGS
jgi:hypothetical protein